MTTEPIVRPSTEVAAIEVERSPGTTIQVLLGPDDNMPNFYTRIFTMEAGGHIPAHRHQSIEHEQVVLEGEMIMSFDGKERVARAGDSIYIPAGVAHGYRNQGEVPVRFICIVPVTTEYQVEWVE